jgi:hypothetical protein
MSSSQECREGSTEIEAAGTVVRAAFRIVTDEPIAGGPIEIELIVENQSSTPLNLSVSGDRARKRFGQYEFEAAFAGHALRDPMANMPDMGGPLSVAQLSNERPWRQALILNDYVALEETLEHIGNGEAGRLNLTCRRPMSLSPDPSEAMRAEKPPVVAIDLAIDLNRDDQILSQLVASLFEAVNEVDPATRLHSLNLLLSLRSVARDQIAELAKSEIESTAIRASQVLATL